MYATGIAQLVKQLSTDWTVRGSNSGWGFEIFRTRPDWPRGPLNLMCNGYRVFLLGLKRPERALTIHPHRTSRVLLALYSPFLTFLSCYKANFTVTLEYARIPE